MAKGDAYWRRIERFENLRKAEAAGQVADSNEARVALIKRMDAGELTLEQIKQEVAKLKRGAKAAGKITRQQALR